MWNLPFLKKMIFPSLEGLPLEEINFQQLHNRNVWLYAECWTCFNIEQGTLAVSLFLISLNDLAKFGMPPNASYLIISLKLYFYAYISGFYVKW
jgi:hypothetical protein